MRLTNEQLELTLAGGETTLPAPKKMERMTRADWWFRQMRQVVDTALDWEPAPRFNPEQLWMPGVQRRF